MTNTTQVEGGRLDALVGLVPAAITAQALMDKADVFRDLAMTMALGGSHRCGADACALQREAGILVRQAEKLMAPYTMPNKC